MSSKISMSFFLQSKRIKVFDENIPGFFLHIMDFQWEPNGSRSKRQFQYKLQTVKMALNDSR